MHKGLIRALGAVLIAIALYSVLGFLILPGIGLRIINQQLANYATVPARLDRLEFNPFSLELTLWGLRIGEPGKEQVGFERLYTNLQADSLWTKALHLAAVELDKPKTELLFNKDGTLNLTQLFMDPVDDSMDNLLPLLNDYQDSWQGLLRADGQIEALYAQVRLKGVAKFDSEDDVERRLKLLINAYAHRTDEALTLGKARRAAVTDIARTLRNIRSDYDSLEHQLALFNREINKRQVSNLQSFRIVLAPNKEALKHIDQIIHSAGQYEEGETLSVFDLSQSAEQDNKNEEAKEYLARLVAANHNQLGLKDLFELAFEITKVHGQPVIHTDIDGAASNGTTMTIKALTNMYLLLHLMDRDQAGRVRLPYYLDEAADIDEKNQAALLETSLQLGFVPILASVKPQVSAQVAIDLEGGSGPNGIYIDEADWKYIRRHDVVKATVNVQADEPELDEV